MSKRRVVFRADGNSQIGLGHVIRSLALADMLKEEFSCAFAIQNPSEVLREQIMQVCEAVIELPVLEDYLTEARELTGKYLQPGDSVVLDGYRFDTDYQQVFKEAGHKLVCIDDIHAYHFMADVVINQAGSILATAYSCEAYTKLCIGPRFALLRKDFLHAARAKTRELELHKILLCMGGADPYNYTVRLMKKLGACEWIEEIHVLIGSGYSHKQELDAQAKTAEKKVFVHSNLSAHSVRLLMERCGTCVCPPSSVSYEFCAVRGQLFLCFTAENQRRMYQYLLGKQGALAFEFCSEDIVENSATFVNEMVENQKKLIDGNSDERLRNIFQELCK